MSYRAIRLASAALALALLCGSAGPALAQMNAPANAAPKVVKTLMVLTPDQVDPSRLLPPPPADGSPRAVADLADVQRVYQTRTPGRLTAEGEIGSVHA